jgi:hypothetical protein
VLVEVSEIPFIAAVMPSELEVENENIASTEAG